MRRILLLLFLALPLVGQTSIGVVAGGGGGSGTVESVAATVPAYMTVTGSPITETGTLAFSFGSQLTNLGFFSPCGSGGAPTFRALCISDFPASVATATNTVSTLVLRDASGNFAAGTITAALSGNATTATTAANLSGSNLSGDVGNTANAITLATVNSNVGSFTNASVTVNAKGLVTAASSGAAGDAPAGSGTEIQIRAGASTLGAVTGSSSANGGIAIVNQAAAAIPLQVTAHASQSEDWFRVKSSANTRGFRVQSDGGVIINQATGATYTRVLDVLYQDSRIFEASPNTFALGAATNFNVGASSFIVDTSGNITTVRHINYGGTTPSVGGSCGTSPSIAGKDGAIRITTGTGSPTSCTVTFAVAWTNAPSCTANASATVTPLNVATTTTTVVVSSTTLAVGEVLHIQCSSF